MVTLLGVGQLVNWWIGASGGAVMLSVDVISSSGTRGPATAFLLAASSSFVALFRRLSTFITRCCKDGIP